MVSTAQQRACTAIHWSSWGLHGGAHVAIARWYSVDLDLGVLLSPLTTHVCAIGHELCLVLFEFGVFDKALVLSNTALLDAAEDEDTEG